MIEDGWGSSTKPEYRRRATAHYHVISRCVRRAFLCGYDRATAKSFDHRKAWVLEKLAALTEIFAIRVHAYAVLAKGVPRRAPTAWAGSTVVCTT